MNAIRTVAATSVGVLLSLSPAGAYEFGTAPWQQLPGLILGNAASAPPPGLYMFEQAITYQSSLVGPGAPSVGGSHTSVRVDGVAAGLLFVPGWTFLGATYDAVVVQPFLNEVLTAPINYSAAGAHNSFVAPVELSWKLGDSGFFLKTGLGMYTPEGAISGPTGLGNNGTPWWTFQPELVVSYIKDGWEFTAFLFDEINTRNSITGYTSGDVFHAEFTATKTIGKWTIGPVGYYVGQVTSDRASSTYYGGAINTRGYDVWAVGGLVGYDFGPATLKFWAVDQVYAQASGGTAGPPGIDTASITKGWTAFASLSYRLWAPETAEPSRPGRLTLK
jgi:hypothetical protein